MNFPMDNVRVFEVTNNDFEKPPEGKARFDKKSPEYDRNAKKTAKIARKFNALVKKFDEDGKRFKAPMLGSGLFATGKGLEYAVDKADVALFMAIIAEMGSDIEVKEIDKEKSSAMMYAKAKITYH